MPQCPSVLWSNDHTIPSTISVDFLLPNSLIITLELASEATLNDVRLKVWSEAKKCQPAACVTKLKPAENYLLVSVSTDAKTVEYYDYSKRLCDLKLFYTFFKVVEIQGDLQEKTYYSNLNKLIGLHINEIDQLDDLEILEFRLSLLKQLRQKMEADESTCQTDEEDEDDREIKSVRAYIECIYAPSLEIDPGLLDTSIGHTMDRLKKMTFGGGHSATSLSSVSRLDINVHVVETDQPEVTYHLNVELDYTPSEIVAHIIRAKLSALKQSDSQIDEIVNRYKDSYILNVCGCDEIFYGDKHKMGAYKYIRKCMSENKKPHFHLISIDKLKSKLAASMSPKESKFHLALTCKTIDMLDEHVKHIDEHEEKQRRQQQQQQTSSTVVLSWTSTESFSVYVDNLVYLPRLKDCERVFLKLAIYQGQEMRQLVESEKIPVDKIVAASLKMNQHIGFDVRVKHLNRCAKLCISLHCISKRKREFYSIGWISMNLFDHKGYLLQGRKKLYLWPATQNTFVNHFLSDGVSGQNPDMDFIRVNVEFMKKPAGGSGSGDGGGERILYPTREQIVSFVKRSNAAPNSTTQDECIDVSYALENDNALLEAILGKDALAELSEQEKNVLWRRREDCLNYPHSLPKLLQAVKWSQQSDVIEMYSLLFRWPDVKPMVAIELLHAAASPSSCVDVEVRSFAVKCLDAHMRDQEVQLCLLQLVQSLKTEPYYDNALTRFLLKRAWRSQRIGFDLFWNLRSEMKNARYRNRFALILEAYCRGIRSYQLRQLIRQIDVVDKLSLLAQQIKSISMNPASLSTSSATSTSTVSTLDGNTTLSSLVKSTYLRDILQKPEYSETLSHFTDPLNGSHVLGTLDATRCRIMTSAKRPLFLTWTNALDYAAFYRDSFELIFKHGDDLRQDMLTLQVLKLMDLCWKSDGLDLKMLIYDCAACGNKQGFIECIRNSMTLFKIQMEGGMRGRYQIDTAQLYRWILANNPQGADEAIDMFTKSCAGFCVATFILGIGDRHPDNIMVSRTGQLFHIDFGHFLGHFKKKYGIKRERVPFVLTEDFTKVITRGSANPTETVEFKKFKTLCENAYRVIRRYAQLIVNLFALMLASDMPELQSIEDIMYLRKTLAIDESDERVALEYFRAQFNEAYRLSYTTKLDWACHALNKKNLI